MNKSYYLVLLSIISIALFSCKEKSQEENQAYDEEAMMNEAMEMEGEYDGEINAAICMWNELSVREEPQDKAKYITTIYLGEEVEYLDETKVDEESSKKREYIKVRLSDRTEGWVQANLMALNVDGYAVVKTAKIYKRPDVLTVSDKSIPAKLFVVVEEQQDGFYKIKGKPFDETWFVEGWVSEDDLSSEQVDVDFSKMYSRAMSIADESKRNAEIEKITNMELFETSVFVSRDISSSLEGLSFIPEDNLSVYSCWLENEPLTDTQSFSPIYIGNGSVGMFAEGIKGILYYNGLVDCFSKYLGWEEIDTWSEQRYTVFEELSNGIVPVLKKGYDWENYKETKYKFDHVNPKFIVWATNNLIPDPNSEIAGVKAQELYNKVMSRFFRLHTRAYLYLYYKAGLSKEQKAYEAEMKNEDSNLVMALNTRYEDKFDEIYNNVPDDETLVNLTKGIAAGFWIRRNMDGTINEIWNGLRQGMLIYDKEWFESEISKWDGR
jgi:hypothetical protein